jgi:hypothetical protein
MGGLLGCLTILVVPLAFTSTYGFGCFDIIIMRIILIIMSYLIPNATTQLKTNFIVIAMTGNH